MIFGAIVGDMVGYPRMFENIRTKQFELFPEGFKFYDGTFQTLMTTSALLRCKNDEPVDIEKLTGAVKDEITAWGGGTTPITCTREIWSSGFLQRPPNQETVRQ